MKPTLSVIIPALNEEANIAAAVHETTRTLGNRFEDYELLLFDDGSRDRTGEIMDGLASQNPRIHVTHNPQPRNLGGVYKQGVAMAKFDLILMVPGDNENPGTALAPVLDALGKADIVIPYTTNTHVRPLLRCAGSRVYTMLINVLFGHNLRYYNGTYICRASDLRSIRISTDSFAFQSEVLLKLLRNGRSYVEVGVQIKPPSGSTSKALRIRNLVNVLKAVCGLVAEIHFQKSDRLAGGASHSRH
jgi:glycosyltransferase involved in cell wall biosynthesis